MKRRRKLFGDLYQLAGACLLGDLTPGQKDRLTTLLLDVLCDPDRFSEGVVRRLWKEALTP